MTALLPTSWGALLTTSSNFGRRCPQGLAWRRRWAGKLWQIQQPSGLFVLEHFFARDQTRFTTFLIWFAFAHLCKKVGFGCTWAAFYSKLCLSLKALWTGLWPPAHSLFHIASNKTSPLRYFAMTLSISLADDTPLPLATVRDLIRDIKSSP